MVLEIFSPAKLLGLPMALFWDTQLASLDLDRHAKQIIARVVERGDEPDQAQ